MSAQMKVRFTNVYGGRNIKGYVSEEPDENGLHHGIAEASDRPVALRWTGTQWVEVDR